DLAKRGFAPGGFPPRGYLAEKVQSGERRDGRPHIVSHSVPDPVSAPREQLSWAMKKSDAPHQQIHDATHLLKSRGCYVAMFTNKTYLGITKCGELEVEGTHEPLIDRETWDAVQATFQPRVHKGDI